MMRNVIRRWSAIAALLALAASSALAQNKTTVTGTITDPSGVPYAGGTIDATLLPVGSTPTVPGVGQIDGYVQPVAIAADGTFVLPLFCNAAGGACSPISPDNTQWQFTVRNPGAQPPIGFGAVSFAVLLTISGDSQDISLQLSAAAPLLLRGTGSFLSVLSGKQGEVLFNNQGIATGAGGFSYTPQTPVAGSVTLNGPAQIGPNNTSGSHLYTYGPLAAPQANQDGWIAPSVGDPCGVARIVPGFAGGGVLQGFASSMVLPGCGHFVRYGSSGDSNHSSGRVTGVTNSVRSTVVCPFSFCQAGSFHIVVHVTSATASCTGTPTLQFFVTYTDEVGTVTEPIPLTVNGGTTMSATMSLAASARAWGEWSFANSAASNISYSATLASPCSVGSAVFDYDVEVVETL